MIEQISQNLLASALCARVEAFQLSLITYLLHKHSKTSFEKKLFFCVGEYAEYGFDQQGWYGMFVACGIWCLADVSSVSPSSEQTLRRRANARNVS